MIWQFLVSFRVYYIQIGLNIALRPNFVKHLDFSAFVCKPAIFAKIVLQIHVLGQFVSHRPEQRPGVTKL